ncbi:MAG: GerW family sporulation protein [Lachnospiraceae bacterium]|nr:GerW family sporulation protein [Lachnospiraceae bacterium]MBR3004550.1 GerW family sporulation protein [Lachnospiraceae bacterium]
MAENFEQTVEALVNGLESHLSTKTIIGEPIYCGDTVIFPMADVSFGVAAGSFVQEKKNNGAGGVGAKVTPSAVLILNKGTSKVVNIKDKDSINKLIDMLPDLTTKLTELFKKDGQGTTEIVE